MRDEAEVVGLLVIWLAFMSIVGFYTVRIGLLMRGQHLTERAYRLRLAKRRGNALRDMAGAGDE